ncbi:MAG: DinB family protein [Acidobacteria bacterium]|nr:DinB family protein [Acidobacteriota bacterium]
MDDLKKEHFLRNLLIIFRETFEGSPEGQGSAYLDRGVGIFNTLGSVSAEAASKTLGGATIAAHAEHAKFYLDRLCEFINGRTEAVNWEQSWLIETVNDAEWDALRGSVRRTYESTLRCFAAVEEWDDDATGDAIAMIAHTAYHLGSIRQIAKAV